MCGFSERSVTPSLCPDQIHRRLHLPPLGCLTRPLSPALRPLRNYKHSFHTKSGQRSPTVRNESRASRIFTTDYHPFALTFSPSLSLLSPNRCSFYNGPRPLNLFSKFLRLQDITFDRERGHISANIESRRKSFIKCLKK